MAGEETKNWTFHHVGVIVEDMDKAVEYYKSLGIIDFPPERDAPSSKGGIKQGLYKTITSYGETIIEDGKPLIEVKPGATIGNVKFCRMGTITFELVQPGTMFREVNGDFLKKNGDGIDHIAYTVPLEHYDEEMAKMKARGLEIVFSGEQFSGGGFAYFDTRKAGGIITELMFVP